MNLRYSLDPAFGIPIQPLRAIARIDTGGGLDGKKYTVAGVPVFYPPAVTLEMMRAAFPEVEVLEGWDNDRAKAWFAAREAEHAQLKLECEPVLELFRKHGGL